MRNIFLFIFCLLPFVACNSKRTMVDCLNESSADVNQIEITIKAIDNQGRHLVYLLDPSCSVCIANYTMFLESLKYSVCNYDSLFTIVLNSSYFMNVDYYLDRSKTYRPETERYIIDDDGELTDYYNTLSDNNNILLFDNGKLIFYTTVFAYKFENGIGLVSLNKR